MAPGLVPSLSPGPIGGTPVAATSPSRSKTCRTCAAEVPLVRFKAHKRSHPTTSRRFSMVPEEQQRRRGVQTELCRRCGEQVRRDLLRLHLSWHTPVRDEEPQDPIKTYATKIDQLPRLQHPVSGRSAQGG